MSRKAPLKCCIKNCSGPGKKYRFPENYKTKWCALLKMNPAQHRDTHRVCELHFDTSLICKKRLKKGAMPTRMLGQNCDPKHLIVAIKSNKELEGGKDFTPAEPLVQQPSVYAKPLVQKPSVHEKPVVHQLTVHVQPLVQQQQCQRDLRWQQRLRQMEERSRELRIHDLHQQEKMILMAEDRSTPSFEEDQRRRAFIREQKERVQLQLKALGEESILNNDHNPIPKPEYFDEDDLIEIITECESETE